MKVFPHMVIKATKLRTKMKQIMENFSLNKVLLHKTFNNNFPSIMVGLLQGYIFCREDTNLTSLIYVRKYIQSCASKTQGLYLSTLKISHAKLRTQKHY